MERRAYLSNISPIWPFERQEEALAAALPGYPKGFSVFRDALDVRQRRGHNPESLAERAQMLRPTGRKGGEVIVVASLAVLAWTAEDMLECLTFALARGATVRVLDAGLSIPPTQGAKTLHEAVKAFADGRKRRVAGEAGMTGGEVSAARRSAAAKAKAESIKAEWGLPSNQFPTPVLLERAGLSYNTAKTYLGSRAVAQRNHQAALKRAEKRKAKQ